MKALNDAQLEFAIQIICKAYKPEDRDTDEKMSILVCENFNMKCTPERIFIHRTSRSSDDFEREHRRIQYGYTYDTFSPD